MKFLAKFIPSPQVQSPYQPPLSSKNKTQNRKLTKADIGTPSNFKHVTHIGWNAKSGFDLSGEDDALRPFLQKAGVSENQLKDRRTRDFIYDFIQTNNVEEIVRKETKKPAAPPVPTRHQVNHEIIVLNPFVYVIFITLFRTRTINMKSLQYVQLLRHHRQIVIILVNQQAEKHRTGNLHRPYLLFLL